jgi:type III secretory pathway component EscV
MKLLEVFPRLAEHRVPISNLDIDSRVFFHWKEKGVISLVEELKVVLKNRIFGRK